MDLLNLAAFDIGTFCSDAAVKDMLRIVGYVLSVFKFAIPIIIVALGMFDFGKAVVAEKEDEIKKQTKRLIYRLIAGLAIFLLPNLIVFLFGIFVPESDSSTNDFKQCETCILDPKDCN